MRQPVAPERRRPRALPQGFTLLEVAVVLTVLMLVSGVLASGLAPWLAFQQRLDTDQRLGEAATRWNAWIEDNTAGLERDPQRAGIPVGAAWLDDGTAVGQPPWRAQLAQALGVAVPALFEDGFHQSWRMHVSRGLQVEEDGLVLHYHVLALLSAGDNGVFEHGTRFDPDSGVLVLAGDDRGVLIDGLPAVRRQRQRLEARLERAAQLWQDWFRARWEGDPERDASVDYFSGPCPDDVLAAAWDGAAGALPPTRCAGDVSAADPGSLLGLAPAELRDGNGGRLRFDSRSAQARNPDHDDPAWRMPPYSAVVSGQLPGGVQVQRTALGAL